MPLITSDCPLTPNLSMFFYSLVSDTINHSICLQSHIGTTVSTRSQFMSTDILQVSKTEFTTIPSRNASQVPPYLHMVYTSDCYPIVTSHAVKNYYSAATAAAPLISSFIKHRTYHSFIPHLKSAYKITKTHQTDS